MNLLFVGSGKGGSWDIRGVQMAAALDARAVNVPSEADWRWADLVVLIKRAGPVFAAQAHRFGVPIVWDALDIWQQPADNGKDARASMLLLEHVIAAIKPALTIGATEMMAAAAGGVYIPHHSWQGLTPSPAHARVQVVGYEGNPVYLGSWRQALEAACQRRGWTFAVNPNDLRAVDLFVAFREGVWDGFMCRTWKSGVKVVNALAAGRPLLSQGSCAVREIQHGTEVERVADLDVALDMVEPFSVRERCAREAVARATAYTLEAVAGRYRAILQDVRERCAA